MSEIVVKTTLKTTDLVPEKDYIVSIAKIIRTRQFGVRVLLVTNEGDYWLPSSYGCKVIGDKAPGTTIPFSPKIVMRFLGYKTNYPSSPVLGFNKLN